RCRHRPGYRRAGSRPDFRGVSADRPRRQPGGGDRARARAVEALRRDARRKDLVRQRARQGQHVPVHTAAGDGRAMTGAQVLVVEDNPRNMKLFRDVLHGSGCRTLEAATGEDAVALATEHRPDLVLMDIQLPDIDGIEALSRLRADDRTASVTVLAVHAQELER